MSWTVTMLGLPGVVIGNDPDGRVAVQILNAGVTVIDNGGGGGGGPGGPVAWGSITGTLSAQADLQTALDGKSNTGHGHSIGEITGLSAQINGIYDAIDGKANLVHGHAAGDISGLATVATTGAYADLSGRPTLGTAAAENTSAFEAAGAVASGVSAHAAATIGVHGITAFGATVVAAADAAAARGILGAAATAHTHGNITNNGAIGSTANLPVITGASGVLQAGSFGTTANTFCQGNDGRLSDARTPTAHTHGLTESYVGEIEAAANRDYTIDLRVPLAREVTEFSIISDSGACTAALKNGSNTIVGSVSVSTTIATRSGGDLDSTHKNLAANAKLVLTLSGNSAAQRVQFCVKYAAATGGVA